MTVQKFFDMVFTNEYHNIRLKSDNTDKVLIEFSREVPDSFADREIKGFATDWEKHIYILWV